MEDYTRFAILCQYRFPGDGRSRRMKQWANSFTTLATRKLLEEVLPKKAAFDDIWPRTLATLSLLVARLVTFTHLSVVASRSKVEDASMNRIAWGIQVFVFGLS